MTQVIQGALHILAPMICEREGVKLRFGGSQAFCTEKDGVVLPDLPTGNHEARILGLGYLNHELEHLEDTDFSVLLDLTKAEHGFTNLLEDIRIEKNRGERYPGAKIIFGQVWEILVRDMEPAGNVSTPYAAMHNYMLAALRSLKLGHKALEVPAAEAREVLKGVIPENVLTKLEILMDRVSDCKSTGDCAFLAKNILKMIEEAKDELEPPPPPPQGGAGGDPGDAQNQQTQQGQDQDNGQGDDTQSSQGDASTDPTLSQDGGGDGADDNAAMKDALNAILAGDGDTHDASKMIADQLQTLAIQADPDEKLGQANVGSLPESSSDTKMVNEASSATNALQMRLHALLQAKALCRTRHLSQGCRLDTKRLHTLKMGNIDVFKRRDEGLKLNTAITILIDNSGSMKKGKIELARQAALAASMAFSTLQGVVVSVYAFPVDNGDVAPLVKFGERPAGKSGQFAGLVGTGSTPMGEALVYAGKDLMQRRETRKILLVATDGEPDSEVACKGLVKDMESMGIEMMGLGIETSVVKDYFDNYSMIKSINDLAPAVIAMLQGQLFRDQAA